MLRLRLRIAALAVLLGACGGNDPEPLRVRFTLDTDAAHRCQFDSCEDYPMGCGATLGVRIVAAESLGVDAGIGGSTEAAVLARACLEVPASTTLCGVDDVNVELELGDQIPTGKAQIQVVIAPPPGEGAAPACPDELFRFDLQGVPLPLPTEPPLGGAATFDIGSAALAVVPLACPNPDVLNQSTCLAGSKHVIARVDDMVRVVTVERAVATTLNVLVGKPRFDTSTTPPRWLLQPPDSDELDLNDLSPLPIWEGDISRTFDTSACVLVTVDAIGATTEVTCTNDLSVESDGHLDLDGLYLSNVPGDTDVLDEVLAAAGLPAVPSGGLVIGRVVDALGQPQAGVVVASAEPSGSAVEYVTEDAGGSLIGVASGGSTRNNGFFIARTAPYGSRWTATHGDGRREDGDFRAGLIAGKASLVMVRLQP